MAITKCDKMGELVEYEIPNNWVWTTIGTISHVKKSHIEPKKHPNKEFNYLSIENVESETGDLVNFKPTKGKDIGSSKLEFTNDDVLYSKLRPYLNKVHIPVFSGISATDMIPIRPESGVEREYVAYYLRTQKIVEYLNSIVHGIQLPRVSVDDFLLTKFPLAPSNEQKRIVSKIKELSKESKSALEALDKIPEIMKKFRQSVLAAAFRGKLVPQDPNDESVEKLLDRIKQERQQKWEEELRAKRKDPKKFKYEEPEPVELDGLFELPTGWTWSNIEFVTENHDGMRVPVSDKERQKMKGTYPYYGASGIIDSVNDFLFDGDYLLIGEDGANLLSRSTPIAFIAKGKFWVNNHAHVLTTLGNMPLEYLESYFNSIDLSRWVTGTAQPKLNQKRMNSIPIPIAPLNEQNRISKRIQELFSFAYQIEKSVEEAKRRADKIDQAILAKAFRGELVPQDPKDEPASVLLERIMNEKELEIKPVKKGKKTY